MTTRWARFARGWIVAVFSTFVAALSHTVGGGGADPGLLAVVVSLAFAGILSVGLSGRTLSTWRLTLAVLLSQLIFHGLFSFGGAGGRLAAPDAGTGHAHDTSAVLLPAGQGAAATGAMAEGHGVMMPLAHLVAAVVTVVALRYGERAFWGLFNTAKVTLRTLVRALVLAPVRRPPVAGVSFSGRVPARHRLAPLSVMRHRGPPVLVLA